MLSSSNLITYLLILVRKAYDEALAGIVLPIMNSAIKNNPKG